MDQRPSDTVDVKYWPKYSTTTWYGVRDVVSLVTAITTYLDTTITNVDSTRAFVKTAFVTSFNIGLDPIPATKLYHQALAANLLEGNATSTITAAVTVQSPQAFYVYSTVKVIHVPAVIDTNGRASNPTVPEQLCAPNEESQPSDPGPSNQPSGQAVQGRNSSFYGVAEDFGYVPQALLDWMLQDPSYAEKYPDLVSCLPGGPSIRVVDGLGFCSQVFPDVVAPVPVLTVNTAVAVQGDGCFHPGACPTKPALGEGATSQVTPSSIPGRMTMDPLQLGISTPAAAAEDSSDIQDIAATGASPASVEPATSTPDGAPKPRVTKVVKGASIATPVNVQETTPPSPSGNAAFIITGSPPPTTDLQGLKIPSPSGQSAADGVQNQPLLIGGLSLFHGSSAVSVLGTAYSIPAHGTAVVVNGNPSPLPVSEGSVEADTEPIIVAGQTLTPGSPATAISGTTYAVPAGAASVLVNGSPSSMPLSLGPTNHASSMASAGTVVKSPLTIAGQLVTPGDAAAIISGTTYSIPTAATNVFINGSPSPLSTPHSAQDNNPALVIASQTLSPGHRITVSGEVISLPATGTDDRILVGGTTESLVRVLPTGVSSSGSAVDMAVFAIDGTSITAMEATAISHTSAAGVTELNASNKTLGGLLPGSSSALNGSDTNMADGPAPPTVSAFSSFAVGNTHWESWMDVWVAGLGSILCLMIVL
ncbi:MAG: hypothetical protein LQ346_004855 [Caloplaca aetnensis]|nr:MAG: hypothetical protein LQ346_004855 [Caloplaca aetnensis]